MAAVVTSVRTSAQLADDVRSTKIVVTWLSHTDGAATLALPDMNGFLLKVVTDPGTAAPTANYDITLVDENTFDAASNLLIDRHTTNTEQVYTFVSGAPTPIYLSGTHTFTVANAGSGKDGVCTFYMVDRL